MKFRSLTAPATIIVTQVSIAIPSGTVSFSTIVTIPTLPDSVLSNWRIFGFLDSGGSQIVAFCQNADLISTTTAHVRVSRGYTNFTQLAATGISVAGQDLLDVDVTVSNPHGSDVGVGPHGHTNAFANHNVTDPSHQHGIVVSTGILNVKVNLLIIHK